MEVGAGRGGLLIVIALVPLGLDAQIDLGRVAPAGQAEHIVAFGDFGTGSTHQHDVARAIARRHAETPFQFGMTMGDNFYVCGVRGVSDQKWETHWEALYTPLGIPFYASLGNHDYGHPPAMCPGMGASPRAEIERTEHSRSWRMPAHYYTFAAGPARFVAIDTEGWNDGQLAWVEKTLAAAAKEPGIKWRIVYGHHPIFTSGMHINERRISVLRRQLLPLLKTYKVDLFIAGHDHDMEHLRVDGMEFLICGSGGAALRKVRHKQPQSIFTATEYGFLDLSIEDRRITAKLFNTGLAVLETLLMERAQ